MGFKSGPFVGCHMVWHKGLAVGATGRNCKAQITIGVKLLTGLVWLIIVKSMISNNLKWIGPVELLVDDIYLDLHNCFDFMSVTHNVDRRELTLNWRRGFGDWITPSLPGHLAMCFADVFHLMIRPRDVLLPFSEDDCLASFGFCNEGDEDQDQFFGDFDVDPKWLWSFEFESRAEIIVGAQSVAGTLTT